MIGIRGRHRNSAFAVAEAERFGRIDGMDAKPGSFSESPSATARRRFRVLHAPAPPEAYDRLRTQREIKRFCEAEGIAHLDLLPALCAAHGPETPIYAPRDTHWNARGHAIAADRIAAALAGRLRPAGDP